MKLKIKQSNTGSNNKTRNKKPYTSSIKYIMTQNFTNEKKNVSSKKAVLPQVNCPVQSLQI